MAKTKTEIHVTTVFDGELDAARGRSVELSVRLRADARNGRHVSDPFCEFSEVHFDGIVLSDLHEPLEPALMIDGACYPDRLVR